jgi:hypothetical protein
MKCDSCLRGAGHDTGKVIICISLISFFFGGGVSWSCGSWIYNYLCNQCLSSLTLWVRISIKARCTALCDKVCQWPATGRWFSPSTPVSSTNKNDRHDITEILLKVALNTIILFIGKDAVGKEHWKFISKHFRI